MLPGQPQAAYLTAPFGAANPLVSPDGAYHLFGEQSSVAERNVLWLEDRRTHGRRLVLHATVQTLTLAWSPDSAAFIVNDRAVSDVENAYIFDAKTLHRVELNGRIAAAVEPGNRRFLKSRQGQMHSYFHATRWLDASHVEAVLFGHTDTIGSECFNLRFRIGKDGTTEKLSQRVAAEDSNACEAIERP